MIISNAQITTKNLCDKAHFFRYTLNKEPKKLAPVLYRGVLGHSALEAYYREMQDGSSVEVCRSAALAVLDKEIARIAQESPEEFEQVKTVIALRKLIEAYAEVYRKETFKVLEVEHDYSVPVNDDINYVLRLDLLVEMTSGEFRGDLVVVDHKFVYNFKTALDIQMDAQLPKYIKALRASGHVVSKGMFNQIRTRNLKNPQPEDLYRRDWLKSSKAEIEQIWIEQKQVALQIAADNSNPQHTPVRTMNYLVCRFCAFQGPCKAELNGDNVTQFLEANYKEVVSPLRQMDSSDVE
jgi:hypothetical protein